MWVSLGLYPLHFISFLGYRSCLGKSPFFFNLALASLYCWFVGQLVFLPHHCIAFAMLPLDLYLLGLLWAAMYFSFIQFTLSSISAGLILMLSWAPLTHIILLCILDPFHSFGHAHSILTFLWAFATHLLGFFGSITISFTFGGLLAFTSTPFTNSFLWAPLTHFAYFLFLIILMDLLLPSLGSFGPVCFLWGFLTLLILLSSLFVILLGFFLPLALFFFLC